VSNNRLSFIKTLHNRAYYYFMFFFGSLGVIVYGAFDIKVLPSRYGDIVASEFGLIVFKAACLLMAYWGISGLVLKRHPAPAVWSIILSNILGWVSVLFLSAAYLV